MNASFDAATNPSEIVNNRHHHSAIRQAFPIANPIPIAAATGAIALISPRLVIVVHEVIYST
jgi:hypothetical protein